MLRNKEREVRDTAIHSLGLMGPAAGPAVPDLIRLARPKNDEFVRSRAVQALGKIKDRRAVPVLEQAEKSKIQSLAEEAKQALGRIAGTQTPASKPTSND